MTMRTPLKKVRGLGSAKGGTDHFWLQRVTAVANLILAIFLIALVMKLAGADHATVKKAFAHPLISVPVMLFILSSVVHMRLGMEIIIEDYVPSEGIRIAALMLNRFFAIFVGLTSIFAVLKLGLGV